MKYNLVTSGSYYFCPLDLISKDSFVSCCLIITWYGTSVTLSHSVIAFYSPSGPYSLFPTFLSFAFLFHIRSPGLLCQSSLRMYRERWWVFVLSLVILVAALAASGTVCDWRICRGHFSSPSAMSFKAQCPHCVDLRGAFSFFVLTNHDYSVGFGNPIIINRK